MSVASSPGPMTTEELFRQHAPFVMRFLSRLGVPAEQADDALQEVFLVVHRNGGYRPGAAKPTSYLANIAIHAATKHRRRERIDRLRHSDASLEQLPSEGTDPSRAVQTQEDLQRLQSALEILPDALRTTLVLVELEGESCLSVAAALGWPVGTVYWRLFEARKKFQAALRSVDARRTRGSASPAGSERRRALRVPSLGMFAFSARTAFERSEAARLLQVAREQAPVHGTIEAMLARHRHLVRSGADLPAWAASCAPHAVTWFGLVGWSVTGGIAVAVLVPLAAAVVLHSEPLPRLVATAPHRVPAPMAAVAALPVAAQAADPTPAATQPVLETNPPRSAQPAKRSALPANVAATATSAPRGYAEPSMGRAPSLNLGTTTQLGNAQSANATLSPNAADAPRSTSTPTHLRAASTSQQHSAPQTRASDDELVEMRDIGNAEHLLATDPAQALAIADDARARFPHGYFREERSYVEVMALLKLERLDEARAKATDFLRAYPDGPYSRRIRHALERGAR